MGTLDEDLRAVKAVEDKIITNKVANFAYTDKAYTDNDADSVAEYNVDNEQNIPAPNATTLKVNETVLSKGFRAKASSLTRMLVNHFFGRVSYNLNKVNDSVSNLVNTLISHRGTANGLATLDGDAKVPYSELYIASETKKGIVKQGAARGWRQGGHFPSNVYPVCVTYGKGLFVAGGNPGEIYTSPDGITWTHRFSTMVTTSIAGITYGNGLFVAAGSVGVFATSTDGITWTQTIVQSGPTSKAITYGNGLFVAVGNAGKIYTSSDGKTWAQRTSSTTQNLYSVTYANGIYVAVGYNQTILTSPDGITWTARTSPNPGGGPLSAVTYGNGLFVAVAQVGMIITSPEGINWTEQYGLSGFDFATSIAYGNGLFVAVGSAGVAITSPDGLTWDLQPAVPGSPNLYGVIFGSDRFVIVAPDTPPSSIIFAFTNAVAVDSEGNMTVPIINSILERLKALEAK